MIRVALSYEEPALDEPLRDTAQGTGGQSSWMWKTDNMQSHGVINKANAIKCYMKQTAKEMTVL